MAIFGYAGVTTDCQTMAAQLAQLQAAGCVMVYFEKAGAAKSKRAELTKALRKLDPGDVLVVPILDRLARSTCDLLNILNALAGKSIGFKSIGDAASLESNLPVRIGNTCSVAGKTARSNKLTLGIHHRDRVAGSERRQLITTGDKERIGANESRLAPRLDKVGKDRI